MITDAIDSKIARKPITAGELRAQYRTRGAADGYVRFERMTIVDRLDLAGQLIKYEIHFVDCEFAAEVDLTGARAVAGIHMQGGELGTLQADRLSVGGDLVLEGVQVHGAISLCGARLEGHLRCSGSTISAPEKHAFNARGMAAGGSVLLNERFAATGEVVLSSARIGGSLDLTGATIVSSAGTALEAEDVSVGVSLLLGEAFKAKGTVSLRRAQVVGEIRCGGGRFIAPGRNGLALDAELVKAQSVCMDAMRARGLVKLSGGSVQGRVTCTRGVLRKEGGLALEADGLQCGELRLDRGFRAFGGTSLVGLKASRELNCTDGHFHNPDGVALAADALICDGRVYLNEKFTADGTVSLINAKIAAGLYCSGGTFRRADHSLTASGLTCSGSVFLNDGFHAEGAVDLTDASVGRMVNCRRATIRVFKAPRVQIGSVFDWRLEKPPESVDVSFGEIGLLRDTAHSWPVGTRLSGLTLLAVEETMEPEREAWLAKAANFAPDVYHQLVRIYRDNGQSRESRNMAVACRRERLERDYVPRPARAWNRFLDWSVCYGYDLARPLYVVIVLGLLGTLLFSLARGSQLMQAVNAAPSAHIAADRCTAAYPCFIPPVYSFELFLPVINFRQLNYWLPNASTGWGMALSVYVWFSIVVGWLVCTSLGAGIAQVFSRRD